MRRSLKSKFSKAAVCGAESLERRRMFSTYTVNASGGGANYTDLETAIANVPAGSTLLVSLRHLHRTCHHRRPNCLDLLDL